MAMLVDRKLLNYHDKISKHWPEFACNGKENLTVEDLLRHESGLAEFGLTLNTKDLTTDNIKLNKVGSILEKCTPNNDLINVR